MDAIGRREFFQKLAAAGILFWDSHAAFSAPQKTKTKNRQDALRIGLIHFAPQHRNKEKNIGNLLALNAEAAASGAHIVLNTELATTGYYFNSREDIASMVEEIPGPTTDLFGKLAKKYGAYVVIGLAEKSAVTKIYYNSAVLLDPSGGIAVRYRKINTEIRWACPGEADQHNIVSTPWGRIGLIICSDAYHSLIPRITTLKGADLLLIPANWPSFDYFPAKIWRGRAYENKIYLAVCNRGGREEKLDARNARSGVYGPDGQALLEKTCTETCMVLTELPLTDGALKPFGARHLQSSRRPDMYHPTYLDLRSVRNLTSFYEMPVPRPLTVAAVPVEKSSTPEKSIEKVRRKLRDLTKAVSVAVLPGVLFQSRDSALRESIRDAFQKMSEQFDIVLSWGYEVQNGSEKSRWITLMRPGVPPLMRRDTHFADDENRFEESAFPARIDVGAVRTGFVTVNELLQPEISVGLSKLGADLIVASGETLPSAGRDALATRAFDFVHIAAAGWDWALTAHPPADHATWKVTESHNASPVLSTVHPEDARSKRFQDRLEVEKLLVP